MPLANFLLLVSFHFLVVEVLCRSFYVVVAELGVFLRLAGVVRQVSVHVSRPVWLTVFQP